MAYKTIHVETALRIGLTVERASKLRTQSEALGMQAQATLERARTMTRDAGLDPDLDQVVIDEGATVGGKPIPIGTVLRNGAPVEEQEPAEASSTN